MEDRCLRRPLSMESLLPPNYDSDNGRFDLCLPRIRPAWLLNESIKSLDSKFPMVPAPTGTIVLYTTPLGEKLRQQPKNREFDLTDPLRPSLSYNYLYDEHLKVYFRSNDIRNRLKNEGFITDDGYVKCSLKEFNEYRQWIRKLKLDELNRERREDKKQLEEAKKERLERLTLERDLELQEIMKRRRERRKVDAKIRQKEIQKEQRRQRKLEAIDRKRREQFMNMKKKVKDRVQKKHDMERERRRKSKDEKEITDGKIRYRIVTKMDKDSDGRTKKLLEKKDETMRERSRKVEQQWYRRQSWTIEYHEKQKELRELHQKEFQHHVEERNTKISRQRRWSQVSYDEIAKANRRAFETEIENAEVFMAKLNKKKMRELEKWKKHFQGMQASSISSMKTPSSCSSVIQKRKPRSRRQSSWDLESCLLKDLGLTDSEIGESAYSKLGIISHAPDSLKEIDFLTGARDLGSLREVEEDEVQKVVDEDVEQEPAIERQFSLPMIVESLASMRDQYSSSSSRLSSRSTGDEDQDITKSLVKHSQPCTHNWNLSDQELRRVISAYVENILQHCSQVLGIKIKLPERNPSESKMLTFRAPRTPNDKIPDQVLRGLIAEYVAYILQCSSEVLGIRIKIPERTAKQPPVGTAIESTQEEPSKYANELQQAITKVKAKKRKVQELLSSILDKAEEQAGMVIIRPLEYEKIKKTQRQQRAQQTGGVQVKKGRAKETGALEFQSQKVQKTRGVEVKKRKAQETSRVEVERSKEHEAGRMEMPVDNCVDRQLVLQTRRTIVKKIVTNIVQSAAERVGLKIQLKLPPEYRPSRGRSASEPGVCPRSNAVPFANVSLGSQWEDIPESVRTKRLHEQNLIMKACQVVMQALSDGVLVARTQMRNHNFFMPGMAQRLGDYRRRSPGVEQTAHLRRMKSEYMRKLAEGSSQGHVPRESDFLSKLNQMCDLDISEKRIQRNEKSTEKMMGGDHAENTRAEVERRPGENAEAFVNKEHGKKGLDRVSKVPGEKVLDKVNGESGEKKLAKVNEEAGEEALKGKPGPKVLDKVNKELVRKTLPKVNEKAGEKVKNAVELQNTNEESLEKKLAKVNKEAGKAALKGKPGPKVLDNVNKEFVKKTLPKASEKAGEKVKNAVKEQPGEEMKREVKEPGEKRSKVGEKPGAKLDKTPSREPQDAVSKQSSGIILDRLRKTPEEKVLVNVAVESAKSRVAKGPGESIVDKVDPTPAPNSSASYHSDAPEPLQNGAGTETGKEALKGKPGPKVLDKVNKEFVKKTLPKVNEKAGEKVKNAVKEQPGEETKREVKEPGEKRSEVGEKPGEKLDKTPSREPQDAVSKQSSGIIPDQLRKTPEEKVLVNVAVESAKSRVAKGPGESIVDKVDPTPASDSSASYHNDAPEPLQNGTGTELGAAKSASELDIKSPSVPPKTTGSSVFDSKNSVRSGASVPDGGTTTSPEKKSAGSPSSAIFRMITMREGQEQCELSPHSSYVVLPQLSSSESAFVTGKMERLLKNCTPTSNPEPVPSASQDRFPVLSPVPPAVHSPVLGERQTSPQTSSVTLPRVSSTDVCPQPRRSPTPTTCTSQTSVVSLPHIGGSNTSLVGSSEKVEAASKNQPSTSTVIAEDKSDKSHSQNEKAKVVSRRKSEISKLSKKDGSPVSNRRDSRYHSTIALVSRRRSSVAKDPNKSRHDQEMTAQAKRGSPHASPRRPSISKSVGAAVVQGRRTSQGGDPRGSEKHQEKRPKTDARRASTQAVKKPDGLPGDSSHLESRTQSKSRAVAVAHKPQHSKTKVSDPVKKSRSIADTKTEKHRSTQQPLSTSESGISKAGKELNTSTDALRKPDTEDTKLVPDTEEQVTKTIYPKTSDDGSKTSELNSSMVDGEPTEDPNKADSTPGDTKRGHEKKTHKVKKTSKSFTANKTKSKVDSKSDKPGNKSNVDIKQPSNVQSKTMSSAPTSKQCPDSKNEQDGDQGVSRKRDDIPKRASQSGVTLQESKHGYRRTSTSGTKKPSEKNLTRRRASSFAENVKTRRSKTKSKVTASMSSTHSRKTEDVTTRDSQNKPVDVPVKKVSFDASVARVPGKRTSEHTSETHAKDTTRAEDTTSAGSPKTVDSDTEVVVHVYVPDSKSPSEETNLVPLPENSEVDTPGGSEYTHKLPNNADDANERSVDDVTTIADKQDTTETMSEGSKNANMGDKPVSSTGGSSELVETKEDVMKRSSSRKAFGDNPKETNLVNFIPRNSLDILKITRISPKRSSELIRQPSPSGDNGSSKSPQLQSSTSLSGSTVTPKLPRSRSQRRQSLEGRSTKASNFELTAEGFGLPLNSSNISGKLQHPSMQRLSSKLSTSLAKVEETESLETVTEENAKEVARSPSQLAPSDQALNKALSITGTTVPTDKGKDNSTINEVSSSENVSKTPCFSKTSSNIYINSASFSDVVHGTQLFSKESGKDALARDVSPRSSTGSPGSGFVPSPPSATKPGVVSPKVSRIKRNLSNASSGRSRGSLASNEMSPTASLEIVKLSSQGSHGWVSSPTSSVKFLPPIEARASITSNNSDDSQKRRPRTAESAVSRSGSGGSRGSNQSKKATIVEIRRSSSGGLRVDGKSSGLVAVKSSSSGSSGKQTVIGF